MKAVVITASKMKKTINGEDHSGKCVTAIDLEKGKIVRLVKNEQGAPMENPYCNMFTPLDVIEITVKEECPLLCQTENIIADYQHAVNHGKFEGGISGVYALYSKNKSSGASFMSNCSYKINDASKYKHSLEIIKVSDLEIEGNKCSFKYMGKQGRFFSLTDPEYIQEDEKTVSLDKAFLVISIPTDNYNGNGYYKFVAAVFPCEKTGSAEE